MTTPYINPTHPSPGVSLRLAHFLNATMVLAMFIVSLMVYDQLPEKVPIHFDSNGNANGWMDKTMAGWLLFALSGLGITLIFYASSWLIKLAKKSPKLLNIPMKKQFLKLPPQAQKPIWDIMHSMMIWMAVPTNALFLYIIIATSSAAKQHNPSFPSWPVFVFVALEVVMIIFWLIILYRSIRSAVQTHLAQP